MRISGLALLAALAVAASCGRAAAQDAPPPPAEPAPPPSPPEPPAAPAACYPLCRSGFLCHQGKCISACNPLCDAGQSCTADARCVPDAPPPPAYPQAPLHARRELEAPPVHEVGREQHDGFMLRLTIGLGGAGAKFEIDGAPDTEFSGVAGSFSVDVGGAISENLLLHGRLSYLSLIDPKVKVGGAELGRAEDLTVTANLIAPAVTYYFMPANVYVTGAVGLSWLSQTYRSSEGNTDAGLGVNVDAGKEFWVGPNWGLGVAARLWWSALKDEQGSLGNDVSMVGAAVLFSATYQ